MHVYPTKRGEEGKKKTTYMYRTTDTYHGNPDHNVTEFDNNYKNVRR